MRFGYSDAVVELVTLRCTESGPGGRMIDAILTNSMLPDFSPSSSPAEYNLPEPHAASNSRRPPNVCRMHFQAQGWVSDFCRL